MWLDEISEEKARAIVWWVIVVLLIIFWALGFMLVWPLISGADEQRNDRWFGPTQRECCCVVVVQEPIPRNKMEREILRLNPNAKLFRTRRNQDVWGHCRNCK